MAKISRRRLARTVVALLREQPKDHQHIVDMLAAYLLAHKQQQQVGLVLLDIAHELAARDGHLYADVTSAFQLDAEARTALERYLKAATQSSTVELTERTEAELLAGVIVKTSDRQLDTSARGKLSRLSSLQVNTPGGIV